ncbi:nuclear transport factor 2 family protein [Saccharothrix sp. BKS2]|uniref:nuclear transport factor 2 family protein n=1 Tax=Saccharothrix sp. BKS2 TaxID=3064400 RepID=UPI0039E7B5DC
MAQRVANDPVVTPEQAETAVRRYYELVDSGDVDGLLDLFAADAEYRRPGYPPLVGREQLARFYGEDRVIRAGRHSVHTVVAAGTEVAVTGGFAGVLKDGREVDLQFADFFSVAADGLFAGRQTFFFAPMV